MLSSYYEQDGITIYCGDAREIIPLLPPSDLVVTSPPYNIGKKYDVHDDAMPISLYRQWLREVCEVLYGNIKANRHVCINIADTGISNRDAEERIGERGNFNVIPNHAFIVSAMFEIGAQYLHPIIWRKATNHTSQFGASSRFCGTYPYPANMHIPSEIEYILRFRKNGKYEAPSEENREASKLSKANWLEYSSQIWTIQGAKANAHPAPFPHELAARCIKSWSFVGDVVLDPFVGSGTTVLAARKCGRRAVGIDVSERYCEKLANRLRQGVLPFAG